MTAPSIRAGPQRSDGLRRRKRPRPRGGVASVRRNVRQRRPAAADDGADRLVAHPVLHREVPQALVLGPLRDLGPALPREAGSTLWRAGTRDLERCTRIEEGHERRLDDVYLAYWTPVTSASSIRPVDSASPGVVVFPAYFPLHSHPHPWAALPPIVGSPRAPRRALPQHTPRIDRSSWLVIAERARHESLRDLALAYGVSHETIRAIVRRVDAAARAAITMAAD